MKPAGPISSSIRSFDLQVYDHCLCCKNLPREGGGAKLSAEKLRSEVISLLPAFESSASAVCYCAVNEVAKTSTYADYFGKGEFTARMTVLNQRVSEPTCSEKMRAAVSALGIT